MQKRRKVHRALFKKAAAYALWSLFVFLSGLQLRAQDQQQKISVSFENASLRQVCERIEQLSGFSFSYSENTLASYTDKINLSLNNAPVTTVLDRVFRKSPLTYSIKGNLILLSPDPGYEKNAAKNNSAVSGLISGEEKNEPVAGATVRIGNRSAVTGTDGSFTIKIPAGKHNVEVSSVGYSSLLSTIDVREGQTAELHLSLKKEDVQLGEVVVTALGISKEKKKLGFAVQEIKGEDISAVKSTNMLNGLQGKVAGLNITQAPTGIANSTRIVLRGESSLNINKNQALVVVDGVPINNNIGTASSSDLPIDYGSGGAEINPDDIESISVLKGPNAAALYGSRAASGVLVIKTKRATSKRLGIAVNSSVTFDKVLKLPDFQNEYGGGTGIGLKYYSYGDGPDGPNTSNSGHNWGAAFEGQSFVQFGSPLDASGNRIKIPWVAYPDNVKDFYVTGKTYNNSISVQKAGEIGNFRASYNNFNQSGIMPNTELHRHQFNVNSGINITSKVSFNANVNYINSYSDNLPVVGYGGASPQYNFIWFERNADINWFKDYWIKGKEGIKQNYYFTWGDNPYMTMYEQLNGLKRNRVFGNAFVNYDITSHFSLMVRTGIDYSGDIRQSRRPISSVVALNGLYRRQEYTYFERNSDFLFSYNGGKFLNNFKWSASAGGNNLQINTYSNTVTANGLVIPNVYNLGNASSRPAISETNTEKTVNSLYAVADLDFKSLVFLQLTGRNDWSSTLPESNNSYFYPSASLSAIVSDIFHIGSDRLNFWKLRLSYASVGNDTDPYQTEPYYDYSSLPGSVTLPATLPNADLKPEITNAYEAGTELRLFKNRLNLDFSFYHTVSKNQILRSPLTPSSGYTANVINAGKITNTGYEIYLQGVPVKRAITWEVSFTGSANRSKVVELTEGINSYVMASATASIEARVGGRMGDIYGIGFLRNDEGKIIYKDGVPVFSSTTMKIGNYNPDFIAGIQNTIRYKDFSLSFLFDGHFGGTIYSVTYSTGGEAGSLTYTLPGREDGIIGDGVVQNPDGSFSPNTVKVAAYTYYRGYYKRPNVEANSFDATFVKLREVALGYTIPSKILRRTPFQSVRFSITGRNLLLFTAVPSIDPETSYVTGSTIVPGIENAQIPSTRSFGATLNVTF